MSTIGPFGPSASAATRHDVRKIAVLRANGIGDFVFALPALEALRGAYPEAEIILLACDWHAEFLAGRPTAVDRVIPIPPSAGVREEPGQAEDAGVLEVFFERMRAERFDVAIQIHGGGRHSNPFTRRLGAALTVGLQAADAEPLDLTVPYVYFQSEPLRYLEVVGLIGASPRRLEPTLPVIPRDIEESLAEVPPGDDPLVVLHPAASDPRRRWPARKFGRIARRLRRDGARVVLVGVPSDQALLEDIVRESDGSAENACGHLSLSGLAGLLSRARLLVSNDSGPLHLAAAIGVPTVGIYWVGNLITAGLLTRSRHRPLVSFQLTCSVCGADITRNRCGHRQSFVSRVRAADVYRAACELMPEGLRRTPHAVAAPEARVA